MVEMCRWHLMGGLTLFYCFKRLAKSTGCIVLTACGSAKNTGTSTQSKPMTKLEEFFGNPDVRFQSASKMSHEQVLNELFGRPLEKNQESRKTACDILAGLPEPTGSYPRYRFVEFPDVIDIELTGRVDIAASPLLQLGISMVPIPSYEEFIQTMYPEYVPPEGWTMPKKASTESRNPFDLQNLIALFPEPVKLFKEKFPDPRTLRPTSFRLGRDLLFENLFEKYIPGVFDRTHSRSSYLMDSVPDIVIHNAVRGLNFVDVEPVLRPLSKNSSLFEDSSWASFSEGMEQSINASLHALVSDDTSEQACAVYLLHRSFGQIVRLKGIDQPAMTSFEEDGKVVSSSLVKAVDFFTKDVHRPSYIACARPGPFGTRPGERLILSDGHFIGADEYDFSIAKSLEFEPDCTRSEARPLVSPEYLASKSKQTSIESGDFREWAHFVSGIVHFVTAFNPDASWWRESEGGANYPLVDGEKFIKLKEIGGILPLQAHRLAGGFIMMAIPVMQKHIVFFDRNQKVTTDYKNVASARFVRHPVTPEMPEVLISDLESILKVTEAIFKIHPEMELLREWSQKLDRKSELSEKERKHIEEFVVASFESPKNLAQVLLLYDELRGSANDFKYILVRLLSEFAKPLAGNDALPGSLSCYESSSLKIKDGKITGEEKFGECDLNLKRRYKKVMGMGANVFGTPVFQKIADSLVVN
jgi:hypothetical protein